MRRKWLKGGFYFYFLGSEIRNVEYFITIFCNILEGCMEDLMGNVWMLGIDRP